MKQILTLSLIFFSLTLFAQPSNDDCTGLIDLGPAPYCDTVLFNNVGATESNIGADNFPPCFVGVPSRDVWFAFSTVDTILDYRITLTGCPDPALGLDAITNPQIAVYRGECLVDELQLLDCVTSANGELTVVLDLDNLTPNLPYFLRINDWSSTATPNEGAFKLCIEKQPPINTVDEGGSTECSGTLTDSGGPDGPYGNNENFVYTICPTAPSECINFEFQYYNVESFADEINIFNGPNTSSPLLASINGANSNNASNGGVCYAVSANSGCMTIQFISDGTSTFDGFLGSWECSSEPCEIVQPISVDVDATPDEIVQSVVFGQTLVTITDVNCANGSVGTFLAGDNTNLGLEKGLLLTSGSAQDAAGANTIGSTTTINNFPGDDDLDILSTLFGDGTLSNDACIVEMDVYSTSNEITFEYVFGSEEYPEFVNQFNDIFAFLVSGPGITGIPQIGNQQNVATLPDGTFVEINSINDGLNWQYYRDNTGGQSVIYDGLTSDSMGFKKSLTARIPTIPCNFYHLKLAIADRLDSSYDSGVFISEINGGWPEIGVNYQNGINYLVEECTSTPDELSISIDADLDQPITVDLVLGGTAQLGIDYTLNLPPTLTFTTGSEIFTFPIQVLTDNIPEGIENITIDLVQSLTCGTATIADIVLDIHDQLEVNIFDDEIDTVIVCAASPSVELEVEGGVVYQWSPANIFSNDTIPNPVATIDQDQWVTVVGSLGLCTDMDSIFLDFTNVQLNIAPGGPILACQGDTIVLTAVNNVNNQNLVWTGFPAPTDPFNPVQVVTNQPNINFAFLTATVEVGGCVVSDFIDLTFNSFDLPDVIDDVTVCENTSVDLASDVTSFTTTFQWTPNLNLDPSPNVSGPIATPDVTTTYTLIANGSNGACMDTFQVTITVLPVVQQLGPDTVFICLGDTATLNAANASTPFTWGPQLFMNPVSQNQIKVFPPVSTWYYTDVDATNCRDSVLVYVDSLPDLSIMALPAKDKYCQGEEVTLISETYEPANFPGIEFMWEDPLLGALTPDSFLNLVINTVETNTYVRTSTLHACTSIDSLQIEVFTEAAILTIAPIDPLCPGESVTIDVSADVEDLMYSWTNSSGGMVGSEQDYDTGPLDETKTFTVSAITPGGCFTTTETVVVEVFPNVLDSLKIQRANGGTDSLYEGEEVVLIAETIPSNLQGAVFNWYFNGELISTSSDTISAPFNLPEVDMDQGFISHVEIMYEGCTFSKQLFVNVLNNPVELPNAFSPNNDGDNDVFLPVSKIPITILKFQVWNRWGQLVFDNGNGEGGWDGKQGGDDAQSDVYVYFLQYEITGGNQGVHKPLKGDVTLLR